MIGVQIPILAGILEYAILLALKKYYNGKDKSTLYMVSNHDKKKEEPISVQNHSKDIMLTNEMKSHWEIIERTVDKWTFVGALAFILTFNIIYWFLALM